MTEAQPRWITYLELLDDYERSHEPGLAPRLGPELLGRELDGGENQLWRETLNQLEADGLIVVHAGMSASSSSGQFTEKGRRALADIRARRADPVARKSAAANGLLRWLHATDPYGAEWHYIESIDGTAYTFLEGERLPLELFR